MTEPARDAHAAAPVHARLLPDRGANGGTTLIVDGVTQSHVNPRDPRDLQLEYLRLVAAVIDGSREPGHPLRVLHLGAGALTLARYLGATRPGSVQHVVELHEEILDLVLAALPLPDGIELTVEFADARVAVERAARTGGGYDLAVVDVFEGAAAPAHLATLEFYTRLGDLLAPDAIIIVNTLPWGRLAETLAVGATLLAARPELLALTHPGVVDGTAPGNLVYAASAHPLPERRILDLADREPRAIAAYTGERLHRVIGDSAVTHDPEAGDHRRAVAPAAPPA